MELKFAEWLTFTEMAARRSLNRSMGKFKPHATKPAAILTAFQGKRNLPDNRAANAKLAIDLQQINLGFYPVIGMGQEEYQTLFGQVHWVVPSSEESFVVQPRGAMSEKAFEDTISRLLQKYGQFGAMVKLLSTPQAFLLKANRERENKGSEVGERTPSDDYYSQLKGGSRADPGMLNPWEIQGERNPVKRVINWWGGRSSMNKPADLLKIGRRFSIRRAEGET